VRRGILVTMVVAALAVLLAPQSALAVKPTHTCPSSFDLGALTFEQAIALPNSQASLADGLIDVAGLNAIFESVDANDDGLICFQSFSGNANPASQQQYAYNVVDNNASVPSG
jgi:hypothetical protein